MIRVANVRGLRTPEQRAGEPRDACLTKYREWLLGRPTLAGDLDAVWAATRGGELPLGCWRTTAAAGDGSPAVCHAQVLAEELVRHLEGGTSC